MCLLPMMALVCNAYCNKGLLQADDNSVTRNPEPIFWDRFRDRYALSPNPLESGGMQADDGHLGADDGKDQAHQPGHDIDAAFADHADQTLSADEKAVGDHA